MLGIEENLDIGVRLFAFRFKNQVAEVFPESPDSQAELATDTAIGKGSDPPPWDGVEVPCEFILVEDGVFIRPSKSGQDPVMVTAVSIFTP